VPRTRHQGPHDARCTVHQAQVEFALRCVACHVLRASCGAVVPRTWCCVRCAVCYVHRECSGDLGGVPEDLLPPGYFRALYFAAVVWIVCALFPGVWASSVLLRFVV
jgi:hypothetical protein